MAKKIRERLAVTPLRRAFLRAPIALYHLGLGRLLGSRFLLLHHVGRNSGKPRETVLEVVDSDQASGTYYVAVGFGPNPDWFRNLQHTPRARIEIGSHKLDVIAHPLTVPQAAERMRSYARRHPRTARMLAKVMGFEVDGSDADFAALPELGLQLVALRSS